MPRIILEEVSRTPVAQGRVELVERKGIGHPDTICDAVMEQASAAMCREYRNVFGRVLHYNLDKGLVVAGRTEPRLGGGTVLDAMQLVFGDRATTEYGGKAIDAGGIVEAAAKKWLREHLRFVDPERHMLFRSELRKGSPELTDLFQRETIGANDTSAAVGYAPLSETEELVLDTERLLNAPEFKARFPEAGEDVKVMGCRCDRSLELTVAMAFVDRFVPDAKTYFDRKREIEQALGSHLSGKLRTLERVTVVLNTLDDPSRGEGGMYLTVLGTSAEGADCGQVGRGNRANGLIALNRPVGTEAVAGKNPVNHVGKIYALLTHRIAGKVYEKVPGLREVYVWLCSQIGRPIDDPLIASAQLVLQEGVRLEEVQSAAAAVIERELADIRDFTARMVLGEFSDAP